MYFPFWPLPHEPSASAYHLYIEHCQTGQRVFFPLYETQHEVHGVKCRTRVFRDFLETTKRSLIVIVREKKLLLTTEEKSKGQRQTEKVLLRPRKVCAKINLKKFETQQQI